MNNIDPRSPNSAKIPQDSDSSSDLSVDSESSVAQNAENIDRGEVAWSQFEIGTSKPASLLFTAAQAGVFKARLATMHELCLPSASSTRQNENNFLNALLWGKKAISSFQAMTKTIQTLAISGSDGKLDAQALKSTFVKNLEAADSQTETNHHIGTRFANYNNPMPEQVIQEKIRVLEDKFRSPILIEQDMNSSFNEMQYLSNVYVAQKMPDKAVAIYSRLLPLLPSITPPWQQ